MIECPSTLELYLTTSHIKNLTGVLFKLSEKLPRDEYIRVAPTLCDTIRFLSVTCQEIVMLEGLKEMDKDWWAKSKREAQEKEDSEGSK